MSTWRRLWRGFWLEPIECYSILVDALRSLTQLGRLSILPFLIQPVAATTVAQKATEKKKANGSIATWVGSERLDLANAEAQYTARQLTTIINTFAGTKWTSMLSPACLPCHLSRMPCSCSHGLASTLSEPSKRTRYPPAAGDLSSLTAKMKTRLYWYMTSCREIMSCRSPMNDMMDD